MATLRWVAFQLMLSLQSSDSTKCKQRLDLQPYAQRRLLCGQPCADCRQGLACLKTRQLGEVAFARCPLEKKRAMLSKKSLADRL
ncbi:MAG: hypothetical protein DWH98_07285 [Planctomycetota bacterium]|nr:MAG: hypothetical protein DWH98_07285 [Planctomycetota bacterium]